MDFLIHGFRTNNHLQKAKGGMGLSHKSSNEHFVIIRLPDSCVLKLVARTMIMALLITAFPWLGSVIGGLSPESYTANSDKFSYDSVSFDFLPLLFRDLANEGLLRMGDRALIVGNGNEEVIYNSQVLGGNEMDLVSFSDSEKQSSIPDETFDFAFTHGGVAAEFIDRALKTGGVVAVQLSDDPFLAFRKPSNYKIVYMRRFDSTIVAMTKTGPAEPISPAKRRLCGVTSEAKKAALNHLEDVLLEPPRGASGKSKTYLKRTKYLPDLMGDSLESYPRRVLIEVGPAEKGGGASWFAEHYPTRNKDFEKYKIETVAPEESKKSAAAEATPQIGMSEWLRRNVKEEEYVVMKAEAEVVESVVEDGGLGLVDELFLECKLQGLSGKSKKSRKAYWECLALYGRLRDEGVAVHQWWG